MKCEKPYEQVKIGLSDDLFENLSMNVKQVW